MRGLKITQSITNREDTSLNIYLKDVSKQELITTEEEVKLGEQIQQGNQEALSKLVSANLRFAISVAKQYQGRGLSLTDLIQEANLGLWQAGLKWDPTRGIKFISYAVWWIRQSILQALQSQCRTVRLPMSQAAFLSKINNASDEFEKKHGRRPSPEELEVEIGIPAEKIAFTLSSSIKPMSLETPFKDEEVGCLLDIVPNTNSEEADENIIKSNVSSEIDDVLHNLSPRESDVLRMHFGLGMPAMSNEEIASRFGVGCERIRQIKDEAICKIKANYSESLRELL